MKFKNNKKKKKLGVLHFLLFIHILFSRTNQLRHTCAHAEKKNGNEQENLRKTLQTELYVHLCTQKLSVMSVKEDKAVLKYL